jgi:hypothetical protein
MYVLLLTGQMVVGAVEKVESGEPPGEASEVLQAAVWGSKKRKNMAKEEDSFHHG